MSEIKMFCSVCRTQLVQKGTRIIADRFGEQMTDAFYCPNESCKAYTYEVFWERYGQLCYGKSGWYLALKSEWIDDMSSALGSNARLSDAVFKADSAARRLVLTFPCWPMKGWQLWSDDRHEADTMGNILGYKRAWYWARPVSELGHVVHVWGARMVLYGIKKTLRNVRTFWRGSPYDKDRAKQNLLEDLDKRNHPCNDEWWGYVNSFVARLGILATGSTPSKMKEEL